MRAVAAQRAAPLAAPNLGIVSFRLDFAGYRDL
jgi:hypothetical protein